MIVAAGTLMLLLNPSFAAGSWVGATPQIGIPAATNQIAQSLQRFVISIDGSPGTRIVAACLVSRGDDAEAISIEGTLPQQREFEATGLNCQIKKASGTGR